MRTEQEMMELIVRVAERDERVRAVYLGGSRCNANAPADIFQDYDVVYVVEDIAPFLETPDWIDVFGERLLMQKPVDNDRAMGLPAGSGESYAYLIQLADGNRVDCVLQTREASLRELESSSLKRVLLDKDGILPKRGESSDESHWVKRPTREAYQACCNEFWWLLLNEAKGLWRGEILYALDMVNLYIRPELFRMLEWQVGLDYHFSCSVGKCGKYLDRFLSREDWNAYLSTFPQAGTTQIRRAVDAMCALFARKARQVGEGLGYPYPDQWERGSRRYIERVRSLPRDAADIF